MSERDAPLSQDRLHEPFPVLREKPATWFVVKCLSVPTNGSTRGLLVLDTQEEGIQLLGST